MEEFILAIIAIIIFVALLQPYISLMSLNGIEKHLEQCADALHAIRRELEEMNDRNRKDVK